MPGPADSDQVFHEGELAVQRRAGVAGDAARLSGMLAPVQLRGGIPRFLAGRTFAAITARATDGALWISPLTGPPGFLRVASSSMLDVLTTPVEDDPLHRLPAPQAVGLLVMEFATRRRLRINGTLHAAGDRGLRIAVEQAYGNCPEHISARDLRPRSAADRGTVPIRRARALADGDISLIRRSDTVLVGTTHPTRGNDASHRGGPPGFVRVQEGELWWPDYRGNNMFNTLGNLQTDPSAALLFCAFTSGETLQISGRAALEWTRVGVPGDDGHTGRRVRFTPERLVAGRLLPLQTNSAASRPVIDN